MATEPGTRVVTEPAPTTSAAPRQTEYTAETWAKALLQGLGAPITGQNVQAIVAWEAAEGGHWNNTAWYNPLNTTVGGSTDRSMNSVGVKQFSSWQEGLKYTIQTLKQSNMRHILNALMQGNDAGSIADAVVNHSPWGTQTINLDGNYVSYGTNHRDPSTQGTYTKGGGSMDPGASSQLTEQDFEQGLDSAGFPKALLGSIPELKKIWDQAIQGKWWTTEAGQTRFLTSIKSTSWYKKTTDNQRHMEALKAEDPTEYQRQLTQQLATTKAMATALGVALTPSELNAVADRSLTFGLNDAEVRGLMSSHLQYKQGLAYTGQVGVDVNTIKQLATNYGVSVSDSTMNNLLQNLVKGGGPDSTTGLDASSLQDYFKTLAISKYPHLQKQLDQGLTVADVADPYKQEIGKVLEQDPEGVSLDHPMIQKALQQPDGNGGFALMPMYQFDSMLKQSPLWLKTNNARDALMDMGTGLLKNMGVTV